MDQHTYRDMHLLNEVSQTPEATQRVLSQRIGVALGLTNLLLRRLAKKGYIKIVNVQRSRLRYLITPKGVMEKARLTREYIEYSLFFYRHVRLFLRERLSRLAQQNQRRLILWGTGELAEIAYLSIREAGLELVAVIGDGTPRREFLGVAVRDVSDVPHLAYDYILGASVAPLGELLAQLASFGVPAERFIAIPQAGGQPLPVTMSAPQEATARESTPAMVESR